ncbi:hypothetical protein QTH97_32295 [Variovorax sp. J22R24]|uniref:hypothetical protein n=1 Tax=Variovorax gracilis TaxID=3053502 RepID=UPI0025763E53|nr:hypothetical protein [Variovorax sp. J22R24]MDM0109640.1 hypothetical protein [Variovorax sp. J22R24]
MRASHAAPVRCAAGAATTVALTPTPPARSAGVPRVLRRAAPLARTRDGVTTYTPGLDSSGLGARVRAHEAVHRSQFAAAGRPFGSRVELEADAHAGAARLLQGRPYAPRRAAPPGMTLNYEPPAWMPDTVAVNQREREAAARLQLRPGEPKPRVDVNQVQIEQGTLRSQSFDLDSEVIGARGRIYSSTRIGIIQDTGNPMVSVITVSRDPLREIGPPVDVPAYPMRIVYSRSIQFRDDKGRICIVEMAGNVHFTMERWAQQTGGNPVAGIDEVLDMVGNVGVLSMRLDGQSAIDGFAYHMRLSVSAQSASSSCRPPGFRT